ncbi:hypothetical protein F8M41_008330 [Gigaspora margarita]|uniref:Uncharacterized protein n=1 Tax=Gigaspora margarita TaxID=4874 RepID=A0A8H4AVR8_GIGMA|nr:hypothetical protein F8M41_008330 [Gigaspora margarita]
MTDENLIQQELCATEPSFVVPAPCPYEDTQGAATQLALAYNEVNTSKLEEEKLTLCIVVAIFSKISELKESRNLIESKDSIDSIDQRELIN